MLASRSLLILDSDPDIRMTFEFLLGKIGFDVFTAKAGDEALRICFEERPRAVLAEVMVPTLNGYDLCQKIKGDPVTRYATKFFFMTARSESEVLLKGAQVCGDFFIPKPVDPNDVASDLYLLFENNMDMAVDQVSRLRVTKRIPTRKELTTPSYASNNRTAVHLNPPTVNSADAYRGQLPRASVSAAIQNSAPTAVLEAPSVPRTGLAEVNGLLASLAGSFKETLTRLNAVIDYIEKIEKVRR